MVDKLGRLRQKGLMRRGELANQSSWGKGSKDRGWKGLGWANREEGAGVVGGLIVVGLVWARFVGLVLSCLVMFCLILSCWAGERDGDRKQLDGSDRGKRVTRSGDNGKRPRHRARGAGPLAYAGDTLGLRREERRRQGGCSNVFIGVS